MLKQFPIKAIPCDNSIFSSPLLTVVLRQQLYLKAVQRVVGMNRFVYVVENFRTCYKGIAHGVGRPEILGRIHVAPIMVCTLGTIFYPCSFLVLDSPNMGFLFELDILRKHQNSNNKSSFCKKDIPSRFLDEERFAKEASSSGAQSALNSDHLFHLQASSANRESDSKPKGVSSG
ncbi:hypothetical protein M9H77_36231 [Catharanthus roseus]|uniref:Uncharacterized protein n=1 Tax=Catharanthus roseus TaxID=4058 RepID=A0ACB9ZR62_CATRO|nr:hypothetical protein M9H77_36231 [Catharanthus roseus]